MKIIGYTTGLLLIGVSSSAHAQAVDAVENFAAMIDLAQLIASIVGFVLFAMGIIGFRKGSMNPGDPENTPAKNIGRLVVGVLLVAAPWFYELIRGTLGIAEEASMMVGEGGRMALAIDADMGGSSSKGFMSYIPAGTLKAVIGFVMFVGFLAFLSGIYALKEIGSPGGRSESPLMTPLMKIGGGIMCMNLTWFSCLGATVMGISSLCVK